MAQTTDPLELALYQLKQERSDLDIAIAALEKRLGRPASTAVAPSSAGAATTTPAGDIVTYHGEFHNLSLTKATEALLHRVNRPLKTPQIVKALQNASFAIKAKNPRTNLYTSLRRSPIFVKVLPDTWDLAEKHPQAAALKQEEKAKKPKARKNSSERKPKPQAVPKAEQERAVA